MWEEKRWIRGQPTERHHQRHHLYIYTCAEIYTHASASTTRNMLKNPESDIVDFQKKSLKSIVPNGVSSIQTNQPVFYFFGDSVFQRIFWCGFRQHFLVCTLFLAFIVRSCPRYSGMHSMRSMHSSIKVHTNCVLRLYVRMGIYTHNNRRNSKYAPSFVRSHKSNFCNTVFFWHMYDFLRVFENRVFPQKKIGIDGMTRFKKKKCLNRKFLS